MSHGKVNLRGKMTIGLEDLLDFVEGWDHSKVVRRSDRSVTKTLVALGYNLSSCRGSSYPVALYGIIMV